MKNGRFIYLKGRKVAFTILRKKNIISASEISEKRGNGGEVEGINPGKIF